MHKEDPTRREQVVVLPCDQIVARPDNRELDVRTTRIVNMLEELRNA